MKEIWFKHYCAMTDYMDYTSSRVGLPNSSRMRSSWFKVEFPGKIAFPRYISPRMQPIDHISTAFVYLLDPSSISGALYHLVATYSVMMGSATDWLTEAMDLANPKSASLARQSESNSMLEGLRSRWMSSPECMYLMPLSILDKGCVTDTWHISYGRSPWCWPWWLRADRSPWNRTPDRYLYYFPLWGYWAAIRYSDGRWATAGISPQIWYFIPSDMFAAHQSHFERHRIPSSVPRSALFAYPPPSKPRRMRPCPASAGFRTFSRCEATVLRPCPLNIIYYNRFAQISYSLIRTPISTVPHRRGWSGEDKRTNLLPSLRSIVQGYNVCHPKSSDKSAFLENSL